MILLQTSFYTHDTNNRPNFTDYKVIRKVTTRTIIKEVQVEIVKEAETVYVYKTTILPIHADKEFKLIIAEHAGKHWAKATIGDLIIEEQEVIVYHKPRHEWGLELSLSTPLTSIALRGIQVGVVYNNLSLGISIKDDIGWYIGYRIIRGRH